MEIEKTDVKGIQLQFGDICSLTLYDAYCNHAISNRLSHKLGFVRCDQCTAPPHRFDCIDFRPHYQFVGIGD